jgi:phosphohistidine phosphatase
MNRQLFIVRHGKSDWSDPELRDIDRPLKNRGVQNAYAMAGFLKEKGYKPELMISSPAARALNTATIFFREMEMIPDRLIVDERMYHAGPREIMEIIAGVPDKFQSVMIFGHNPCFTQLANLFLTDHIYNIPTAGVVFLNFAMGKWQDITKTKPVDHFFEYPRKL